VLIRSIDVDGDVDIQNEVIINSLNFAAVSGILTCDLIIDIIRGAPNNVGGDFHYGWNQILPWKVVLK
jgi:hypothetical protein